MQDLLNLGTELEIITVAAHQSGLVKGIPSGLWSSHVDDMSPNTPLSTDAFSITVGYVIDVLSQSFGSSHPDLITELGKVRQRVNAGELKTVRRVELDLLEAGKVSTSRTPATQILPRDCRLGGDVDIAGSPPMQSSLHTSRLFDKFVPQVRRLCDPIYSQQGFNQREKYHSLGVELIECLAKESSGEALESDLPTQFAEHDVWNDFLHDWVISSPHSSEPAGEPLVITPVDPTADPLSLNNPNGSSKTSAPRTNTESASPPTDPAHEATDRPAKESTSSSPGPKVEAQSCCEICGYRPKGHPQWFKGSSTYPYFPSRFQDLPSILSQGNND